MLLFSRLFVFKSIVYFKFSNIFGLFIFLDFYYTLCHYLIHAFYFTFVKINK